MIDDDAFASDLRRTRETFLALVADVRPDLHRYCARMTGSIADGEDIVQETLAQAYYTFAEVESPLPLRAWLFRVAHHRALDYLRRYDRRMVRSLDAEDDFVADVEHGPEDAVARDEAVRAALATFGTLVPMQRSAVILKDVLGHSVDEIARLLEVRGPAVKAALHRGRAALRASAATPVASPPERVPSAALTKYVHLFNARDWDGVRGMLAEDVRLDLVSRSRRVGRRDVSGYVSRYSQAPDWYFRPGWLDGCEVIAAFTDAAAPQPYYFVELGFRDDQVISIRDFRYVPYIAKDAEIHVSG